MPYDKILTLSARAGQIILENGGEVYRVEETAARICSAYSGVACESFATTTAIILSLTDKDGSAYSVLKRVKRRGLNLQKVDRINQLSRKVEAGKIDLSALEDEIEQIDAKKPYPTWLRVFAIAVAAGVFANLFMGSIRDMFCAAAIAVLIQSMRFFCIDIALNDFIINIVAGIISAALGFLSVFAGLGDSMNIIVISTLMISVPGLILTNGIRDIVAGDLLAGTSRLFEAFFIAVGIAVGSGLVFRFLPIQ